MMAVAVVFSMVATSCLAGMVVTYFSAVQSAVMIMVIICAGRRAIMMMGSIRAALIITSHAADKSSCNTSRCVCLVIILMMDLRMMVFCFGAV